MRASSIFFKYSISIVTRQCYFRPGVLFVRLQPYRLTGSDRLRKHEQFFFLHRKGGPTRTAQGDANGNARGATYRVTPFNGYRFASAKSRALKSARSSPRPGHIRESLWSHYRADIQADERHVRNAFVISNRDSASKSSPLRRSTTHWTFRGWCTRTCSAGTGGALF